MTMKKILIVDDAPLMRMVVMNMVQDDPNLEVVGRAANGKEALKLMAEKHPDLVVLDLEMPEMDGLTFLRHASAQGGNTKYVVLSAVTGVGSTKEAEAKKLGAHAVVSKPSGNVSMDLAERRGTLFMRTIYNLLSLK